MKLLDRVLRDWRIAQATSLIPPGAEVLDIGCHDGALFRAIGPALRSGLGLDGDLLGELEGPAYRLVPGHFPEDLPPGSGPFDVVTMLAVFEHIPTDAQPALVAAIHDALRPGGLVVITVPSPAVDQILDVMIKARVLDGMETEQHYGFVPADLPPLFADQGFELTLERRFQLGLNNLYVFTRPA
ncbi:class I SAM-dependent methyltransferase [Dermatobacter hominis]|uniref:class I SAM-dependent methyltransferase n=1 Tax=Dermatobacter hominis TaxID=2884263 RepID=UPI001D12196C|nr:class I SAM-dependent methyltransferase [Dermatobacter hominis]UDY35587.1 class I SAM-dependent methyltransferase [Dermatobacter hominis]